MKRIIVFVFLIGFIANSSFSQQTINEQVETFFEILKSKSSYEAIDNLFGANEVVGVDEKVKENVKTRVYSMIRNLGKLNGYELVKEDSLTSCIKKYTYLAKYDKKPILFEFEFYKPKDKWEILTFKPIRSTNNMNLRGK